MKEYLAVSACLMGCNCKYNGGNNLIPCKKELEEKYHIIYICPESASGLKSPRDPSEIVGDLVLSKSGEDVTSYFKLGAKKTLNKCIRYNVKKALLKESSPSCGVNKIYDGTFSKSKIKGMGIATRLLFDNNIELYTEDTVELLLK